MIVGKVFFCSQVFFLSDPGFRIGSVKFFHIGSLQQHCCLKSQDRFAEGEAALTGRHGRRAGQAAQALQAGGGRLERDDGEALDVRRVRQVGPAARLLHSTVPYVLRFFLPVLY